MKEDPHSNLHLSRSELLQAEEAGEGNSTALPATLRRVLATPGRGTAGEQKSLSFTEKMISHTAHSKCASWSGLVPRLLLYLQMQIFMHIFPVDPLFHHLLHYMGNAVEIDETFSDLFHILKLKALKTKRFHYEGRELFVVLVQHPLHRTEIVNIMFILSIKSACVRMRTHTY